jgi:hypothetical protein
VAGVLLIFALFCIGLLVIRYLSYRLQLERGKHEPTVYVDAWRLAGERFRLPEEQDDYEGSVDVDRSDEADPNDETKAGDGPADLGPEEDEDDQDEPEEDEPK